MHFHRDMLATCDSYGRHVLRARARRTASSARRRSPSPSGSAASCCSRCASAPSTILLEKARRRTTCSPPSRQFGATVCFTAPTAYRAMLAKLAEHDISSLRKCVSAGETLPKATFDAWHEATGIKILDGIGATEMLHIFIGSPERRDPRRARPARPVPGYEARVVDDDGREVPPGTVGRLAVRGPTGCRYLADDAPDATTCSDGWNITGDTYLMDADGYFWYQARSDDMIISAGYNIAGPEVEAALLTHPAVAECGVVGAPDEERGQIVKAYVVLRAGHDRRRGAGASAAGLRQGDDRAVQVSARDRIRRRAAEDADRQAAALRAAPHGRRGRRRASSPRKAMPGTEPNVSEPRPPRSRHPARDAAAAGLAAPEGLRQRHQGARRNRVRRRHGRLGRARPISRKASWRRRSRRSRTSRRCWPRAAPTRAHRAADLVRASTWTSIWRPAGARRRLSRGDGTAFPGHGGGRGQPAGRAARRGSRSRRPRWCRTDAAPRRSAPRRTGPGFRQ